MNAMLLMDALCVMRRALLAATQGHGFFGERTEVRVILNESAEFGKKEASGTCCAMFTTRLDM